MVYKNNEILEDSYKNILLDLGKNLQKEVRCNTPIRAAQAFRDMTNGYNQSLYDITNNALFDSDNNNMVVIKNIQVHSLCEHHILPFIGICNIGYIPNNKVLGLSKFSEIVNMFSRRLQIQERLTNDIAKAISEILNTEDVGVIIEAKHMCMAMRGIEKDNQPISSSVMLGEFNESYKIRQEFFHILK